MEFIYFLYELSHKNRSLRTQIWKLYIFYLSFHTKTEVSKKSKLHTFPQIAGSAVRLLTKIPHCCTIHIGVFSDPMWSINLSVSTTGLS